MALGVGVIWLTFRKSDPGGEIYQPLLLDAEQTATALAQVTATPLQIVVQLNTATPNPTVQATPFVGVDLSVGYTKQLILARFSNYFPALSGINCATDCELLADGTRTDEVVNEGMKVVACPNELLLGTRIEYPPDSGLVWTCRDRGSEIYFYYTETGTPIYWFDFLSPTAWVDWGSYIQVQVWVPEGQDVP